MQREDDSVGGAGRLSIADRCTPCRCSPRLPMPVRWLWLMPNEEPRRSRFPTPAYTSVQTLEFRCKSPILSHFCGTLGVPSTRQSSLGNVVAASRDRTWSVLGPAIPKPRGTRNPRNWHDHVRQLFTIPVPTRYHGSSAVTLRAAALAIPLAKAANGQAPGLESRRHRSGRCRLMGKPSFPNNKSARPKY